MVFDLMTPPESTPPSSSATSPFVTAFENDRMAGEAPTLNHAHTHPELCNNPQWNSETWDTHPLVLKMSSPKPPTKMVQWSSNGHREEDSGHPNAIESLGPPVSLPRTMSANAMGDMRDLRSGLHRSLKYSFWHRSVSFFYFKGRISSMA